jgi:excisionase family DNA binding protein
MGEAAGTYGDAEAILDAPEAAALLRVSVKTLLRLAREGKLTGRKVGREWRFCQSDVVGFVRSGEMEQ